jgi:Fur family ferric uptake transcriptional regulator
MTHCHTIIADLRQQGYRITPQREMIIEIIAHSNRHMTAEDIFGELQVHTRAINLATVYRTLDLLVEGGFASRNDIGSGKVVYSTMRHGPHIHLVCRHCGQVIDADYHLISPVGEQLQEQYGFSADLQHISIFGVCAACQSPIS